MDNIYAVTFTSLDGNVMSVEVDAETAGKAQAKFIETYESDPSVPLEVKLVSNRQGFEEGN